MPWKNGLGYTDQIAIEPASADLRRGDYLWRLSTAKIEKSSPFSVFENHDRLLMVLEGAGLRLTHVYEEGEPGEEVLLSPHQPYEFLGDIHTKCELVDGPVRDLSLFFRKDRFQIQSEVISGSESEHEGGTEGRAWGPRANTTFLYQIEGNTNLGTELLEKGELLRLDFDQSASAEVLSFQMTAQSKLLIIEIMD
jgi:environmental stress-induced protein Ves